MKERITFAAVLIFAVIGAGGCGKKEEPGTALRPRPGGEAAALDAKIAEVEKYKMEHTAADTSREQLSEDLRRFERDFAALAAASPEGRVKERAKLGAESMRLTIESLAAEGERADELAWEAQEKWRLAAGP